MNTKQVHDLLLQALEHEMGGAKIYRMAVDCAAREDLGKQWAHYLAETENHVSLLREACLDLGIDPDQDTPGRRIVKHNGTALLEAMGMARKGGDDAAAQIVAAECVVLAETKDHLDWSLVGKIAEALGPERGAKLAAAFAEIEDQEDQHLYQTKGWGRELWLESLGLPAVLPPPEVVRDARTAIGAARAEQAANRVR